MTPLSQAFLDNCPVENGFRQRGTEMTRIEVFVDAAFAFALTLLVISFDAMPGNWDEVVIAMKNIPAFVAAAALLVWLWYEHSVWSRRFGLEDSVTVFLSTVLLIVMLIYIYPMRLMAGAMFAWFTQGYLPQTFDLDNWYQLRGMFAFMGLCFAVLCAVFALFNLHALRLARPLGLNAHESHRTRTAVGTWAGSASIGLVSVGAAAALPDAWTPFAGFSYALLGVWIPLFEQWRARSAP